MCFILKLVGLINSPKLISYQDVHSPPAPLLKIPRNK